jgi:hypothetical protein
MAVSTACPLYLIANCKHKGLKYHHGDVEIASCAPFMHHRAGQKQSLRVLCKLRRVLGLRRRPTPKKGDFGDFGTEFAVLESGSGSFCSLPL